MNSELPQIIIVDPGLKKDTTTPKISSSKKLILLIAGCLLLLVVVFGAVYVLFTTRLKPQEAVPPPLPPINGATFILEANPVEVTLGSQIKVTVLVKSDLDSANLFIAKLKFPNNLLQAKSIDLKSESSSSGFIKNWFISNWVDSTIDNETGSVSLVGGVPNPGFQTQKESSGSAMADIIFTPKYPGEASISFDDTSTIYRNSDNANILVSKKGITVKILGEIPVVSPSATVTPTIEVPISVTATPTVTIPISTTPPVTSTPTLTQSPTPTPTGPLEGDTNQDGKVDLQDLSILLSVWGSLQGQSSPSDINHDGVVNVFDYGRLTKILRDIGAFQ